MWQGRDGVGVPPLPLKVLIKKTTPSSFIFSNHQLNSILNIEFLKIDNLL